MCVKDVDKTVLERCGKHTEKITWILHDYIHGFSMTFQSIMQKKAILETRGTHVETICLPSKQFPGSATTGCYLTEFMSILDRNKLKNMPRGENHV